MKKKLSKAEEAKQTQDYIAFLEKRLASKNYKAKVPPEEYAKEKAKLDKARFRLKIMKGVK